MSKKLFPQGLPDEAASGRACLEAGLEGAEVERRFRRAVSSMQKGEAEAAFFLVEIDERELWRQLGFSSVIHYACEAADIGMNKAYALLRIGRRLRELHLIRRAFIEKRIGWTKIREILRLKSRFSEKQVIEKAESWLRNRSSRATLKAILPDHPVRRVLSAIPRNQNAPCFCRKKRTGIQKARSAAGSKVPNRAPCPTPRSRLALCSRP